MTGMEMLFHTELRRYLMTETDRRVRYLEARRADLDAQIGVLVELLDESADAQEDDTYYSEKPRYESNRCISFLYYHLKEIEDELAELLY